MGKKSQRFPGKHEKTQSGCMWGFISIFDFRHNPSTRKLITDTKRSSKHAVGAVPTKNKFETLSNLDEEYQGNVEKGESKRLTLTTDADKPSVKKLIEKEMFIDQGAVKDLDNVIAESKQSKLEPEDPMKIDSKRRKKSRKKSRENLDATLKSEFSQHPHSRQQSKDNLDLDKLMEDIHASSIMHDNEIQVNAQSNQRCGVISENVARDKIHDFVTQMILKGKDPAEDGKFLCSQELLEALEVISSDKELFLRLLQDPNSLILKYVQELENAQGTNDKEDSSVTSAKFSEQEDLGNLKQTKDIVSRKHHNFFRKKVKTQSKSSTEENGKTELPNRIVILKPVLTGLRNSESENNLASSLDSHDFVHYKGPFVRTSSPFSLTGIKNKLKHAMGKEIHGNPERPNVRQNKGLGGKTIISRDNVGMRSPNKDHFFIEKIARPMFDVMKGNKASTLKDSELILEHEDGSSTRRISNIYIEAKKHLSEMLDDGDENSNTSSRHIPKSLGRILALPEYNFSPLGSPGRDLEHHFVTAQTRFSASDKTWEVNEESMSPEQATVICHQDQATNDSEKETRIRDESSNSKVEEVKSESNFSHDLSHGDMVEAYYPVRDEIPAEGNVVSEKEVNVLESSSDPVGFPTAKDQNHDISEVPDGAGCSQCLNQNQLLSPLSSPSHCFTTKKIEDSESTMDASGRPSPVSFIDTPFLDDDLSPKYSRNQTVKLPVQPLQIQFEEYDDSSPMDQSGRGKYSLEENELIYDYVKAVLQASGLTRDQLLMKCLSSDKILDPSLFDQVEFFSNLACHDQLLFDCINEVLMEVCLHYYGVSPCVSFVNPSIRPTPSMKKFTLKVWEGVCWQIIPLPPPHTLEQIVRKDMARSGTWMDLRLDAETVGFEMSDTILAELIEDTTLSFVDESQ